MNFPECQGARGYTTRAIIIYESRNNLDQHRLQIIIHELYKHFPPVSKLLLKFRLPSLSAFPTRLVSILLTIVDSSITEKVLNKISDLDRGWEGSSWIFNNLIAVQQCCERVTKGQSLKLGQDGEVRVCCGRYSRPCSRMPSLKLCI